MLSSVPRDSPVSIQLCECSQELKPDSKNQKALYASVYTFQLFAFTTRMKGCVTPFLQSYWLLVKHADSVYQLAAEGNLEHQLNLLIKRMTIPIENDIFLTCSEL